MTPALAPATTVPQAAAREARLLVETHRCIVCRGLPERPFTKADVVAGVDYRPRKPAAIVSGRTARSFRCKRHERARKRAASFTQRTADKATRYGVPRAIQVALWEFQGCACPCGRKAAAEIPPGVTLDHWHDAPCILRGDHPENRGCVDCVTGFVCAHDNRETIGRLEQFYRGDRRHIVTALRALADHIADPPLRRLRRERPDLFEESAA